MSVKTVSNISNAYSTGGGGHNYEQQVQAMFLLSLLVDGFCPVLNKQVNEIHFQAKYDGYDVDDFVVITSSGKLLCQVKHSICISKSNRSFLSFISSAWSDYNKELFDKENDYIALVTEQIPFNAHQSLRFLHEMAIGSIDEREFYEKVGLNNFSSDNNRKVLTIIENCIEETHNAKPTQLEIWSFIKHFILLIFDLDCSESTNYALSTTLIKLSSSIESRTVWSRLVEYASLCNQSAASISKQNIDKSILDLFALNQNIQVQPVPVSEVDPFVLTVALIGTWRKDNGFDQHTIESISGLKYTVFESKAKNMLIQKPEYLCLSNGIWSVKNKEELLDQCKGMLFDDTIERTIVATQEVLSKSSKIIAVQPKYYYSSLDEYDNSVEIRNELSKSLCWINRHLSEISNCNKEKIETALNQMVKSLLNNANWILLASLRSCIQYLAELSPEVFLSSIELNIIDNPQEIVALFPCKDSTSFGQPNYITELLWALEVLAWSPEYLVRAIRVLGMLEALPYEQTNWHNTPINSIVSILLPCYPQTIADKDKRKNALSCLKTDNPNVYWNVIKMLLPNRTTSTTRTPKPQYLTIKMTEKTEVTNKELIDEYSYLLNIAVETCSNNAEKLAELSDQLVYMNENTLICYLVFVEKAFEEGTDEQKFSLWLQLKKEIVRIKPTEKMIIAKYLDRIQSVLEKHAPEDIRIKYRVIYLADNFLLENEYAADSWDYLENKKNEAVYDIYIQYGISETESFGRSVSNKFDVAYRLGKSLTIIDVSGIIDACFIGDVSKEFSARCIEEFVNNHQPETLLETSLCQKDEAFIVDLLSKIRFSFGMLEVVNRLIPSNYKYMEKAIMPYTLIGDDNAQLTYIVKSLMSCKRYVTALNLLSHSEYQGVIDLDTLFNLLKLVGTVESIGNETLDHYAVLEVLDWFQNQESISLESRSEIDFIYLPIFDDSIIKPHALYTRLSIEPEYFCDLIELFFKKDVAENKNKGKNKKTVVLNDAISERLFKILFKFQVVPGTDWNGNFDKNKFILWFSFVKNWSKVNKRYAVTMHTVGSGLSYSQLDSDRLPDKTIIEILNKAENEELRRGYFLGIVNQRGAHVVDPEGKPEYELAKEYSIRADVVEARGYSRYAELLRDISHHYEKEAERNINSSKNN